MLGKDVRSIVVEWPQKHPRHDISAVRSLAGQLDLDYEAIEEFCKRSRAGGRTVDNGSDCSRPLCP